MCRSVNKTTTKNTWVNGLKWKLKRRTSECWGNGGVSRTGESIQIKGTKETGQRRDLQQRQCVQMREWMIRRTKER